jgi:predicted AAA+ superfamily ATPase
MDISAPKTYNREVKGCLAGAKGTKCDQVYLLTYNETRTIEKDGFKIKVMPVWEWLLKE